MMKDGRQTFRGLIFGLSRNEVEAALHARSISAAVLSLPPPLSLALGLSRREVLEASALPARPLLYTRTLLLGLWAGTSVAFFATLASLLLGILVNLRLVLLSLTAVLGLSALALTIVVSEKTKGSQERGIWEDLVYSPWDLLLIPELALVFLALALGVLLAAFVFLVLWLPLVFLALNVFSLGELWRSYRTVMVVTDGEGHRHLGSVGRELIRKGGVLSKAWDQSLGTQGAESALKLRRFHSHVHGALLIFGGLSLSLTASAAASRAFPTGIWDLLTLELAAMASLSFLVLIWTLHRLRLLRTSIHGGLPP